MESKELYEIFHDETTAQRAKDRWIKEGDANTKYFQSIASVNFQKHFTPRLIIHGKARSERESFVLGRSYSSLALPVCKILGGVVGIVRKGLLPQRGSSKRT